MITATPDDLGRDDRAEHETATPDRLRSDATREVNDNDRPRPERDADMFKVGSYTFENPNTGGRKTFRIEKQPIDARFAPGRYVLALLTGPDNERSYTSFAFIDDHGVYVFKSKRSVGGPVTEWERFAHLLRQFLVAGEAGVKPFTVLFEARCVVCNRKLTVPSSIRDGIGPECAGKSKPAYAGEAVSLWQ